MDEAQQYVRWRAAVGAEPDAVARELQYSGWSPTDAQAIVASVWPRVRARGLWMLVVTLVLGLAVVVITVQLVGSVWLYPGGPRATLALLDGGIVAFGNYLLVTLPLWIIGTVLFIVHLTAFRRDWARLRSVAPQSGLRKARSTLLALSWIVTIGVPVLAAVAWIVLFIQWVALGIMCGEAVSENCGI